MEQQQPIQEPQLPVLTPKEKRELIKKMKDRIKQRQIVQK